MKVFIAGIDGYLGWSLAQYMAARGHEISGVDNESRRAWVEEVGSCSVTPISVLPDRRKAFCERYGSELIVYYSDLLEYDITLRALEEQRPDCIVHLAEIPSAPFSMIDARHACLTHRNNLEGTLNLLWAMKEVCPEAHLLKLGTMGEYGTPNVDIPEGFFDMDYRGRRDRLPFPRQPGSFYHLTKVHDTYNIMFACKVWGLRSTDIMQGVVFGTKIPEMEGDERLLTRFDIDECFGTAINRFCASAVIEHPLTVYGAGHQKRGFLPLKDSMQCLTLAAENPPKPGEYRVFNQFERVHDLTELALMVQRAASELGIVVRALRYENPRREAEEHYYNPDRQLLLDLGYKPTYDIEFEVTKMIEDLVPYRGTIEDLRHVLIPQIHWDGSHAKCVEIGDVTRRET